jgi:hypothetical protein
LKLLRPPFPLAWPGIGLSLLGLAFGTACGTQNETAALRSLRTTGEVSILCLGPAADGTLTRGLERGECPDLVNPIGSPLRRQLTALVTQPTTGEVAAIDLGVSPGRVIDYEATEPGYSFLPVGAEPTSIVSTPGGIASFVAVRETGREGIFALPSSCVSPRPADGPIRDIRTWPACRLPTAPGPLAILMDPAVDHDQDPLTPARVRERCAADYVETDDLVGAALAASREQCPADLALENSPPGRRKLAVTLPSLSEVWVLDAQELLDRAPGSFADCLPETRVALQTSAADQAERLPADLQTSSASCLPSGFDQGPPALDVRPWPVDLALDDEGRLYLADSQAPLIHRLDGSDPCTLAALPALYPLSYTDPNAVITTRKVAVSSLTASGKRFVYAIDNSTTNTAGTLIPFDVSPGATDRTPIVRERAAFTPFEPPDRIQLPRDVSDVEFAFQDLPISELGTGVAVEGVACDPNPLIPLENPAARYRPTTDQSTGARPSKLRGTFAFAALHSGQLAVIDVDDLDGACRRPVDINHGASEDLAGCRNDDPSVPAYQLIDGTPTVSAELSCNVVVPHRARSRSFFSNSGAGSSAALLAFPTLTLDTGRSVLTDQSDEGRDQPKMLGARFAPGQQAELLVGPVVYQTEGAGSHLELDPAAADRASVLLSYEEPRAYIPGEDFTATYEGVVRLTSLAIFRAPAEGSSVGIVDEGLNASFCGSGVQDQALAAEVGRSRGVTDPTNLATFARNHADYVQITAPLLEQDDRYWQPGSAGAECGAELFQNNEDTSQELRGRPLCEQFFSSPDTSYRDLRIVEASEDRLTVEPRQAQRGSDLRRRQLMQFVSCCFPEPATFVVRGGNQWVVRGGASGVVHHIKADPASGRCVNDCNPLTQRLNSRVFDISCSGNCPRDERNRPLGAGPARPDDFVCVVDDTSGGIDPNEPGSECVFQSITTRFAIYRGLGETARDTHFRWVLSDGFAPLTVSLTTADRNVSTPRSLLALPEIGQLLVTDGTALGLTTIAISSPSLPMTAIY